MDDKTERLRDIFVEVADEETVTESQVTGRGTLSDYTESVDLRIQSVIAAMRDRFDFQTELADSDLVTVVQGFHEDLSDADIASRLDNSVESDEVTTARIDLHLLTDDEMEIPIDPSELTTDQPLETLAEQYDIDQATLRTYRHIATAREQRTLFGDRYREEFERILDDRELSERMTEEIRRTGLEEATEDIETNVSF